LNHFWILLILMKKWIAISWLIFLFSGIATVFWYNEWKYSLPTPVPKNYQSVEIGDYINLNTSINPHNGKPVFVHFFNPNCPCSKFNIPHVRSLVKEYSGEVNFVTVAMCRDSSHTEAEIQDQTGIKTPVYFDQSLAKSCGVYSTPQAVILTSDNRLFYRGNFNKSRYCTDKKSYYARIALDSLLNIHTQIVFSQSALKAYGCQLPTCTK